MSRAITPNHTPLTWEIWSLLTIISLTYLIIGIITSIIGYRKSNREFLTIQKVTILALFLAIYIVQIIIFKFINDATSINFSFNSITTITVGFICGPLEGILFGWVADSFKVLINGWGYQFLPSLLYPMIGLTSALFGMIYWKKNNISNLHSIIIFESITFILLLLFFPLEFILISFIEIKKATNDNNLWFSISMTIIMFILIQLLMIYVYSNKLKGTDIFLLTIVLVISFSERMIELVIRPFTQYFSGYEADYGIALYTRIISSTYLIPSTAITSFLLIKATMYAMETTGR